MFRAGGGTPARLAGARGARLAAAACCAAAAVVPNSAASSPPAGSPPRPSAPALAPGGPTGPARPSLVVEVPRDAPNIQAAVDRAPPGTLVLIDAGVYREEVVVSHPGVVIRGVDRNRTILEGDFRRRNGIQVVRANGVAIENLTARDYLDDGFIWNGVDGYRGSYLTAYHNARYGLYAIGSLHGQLEKSDASGNGDSGFYVGQCRPCHAVVTHVVAEYNALGFSATNADGDLVVVDSAWRHNRSGLVLNSLDLEPGPPQGRSVVARNRVEDSRPIVAPRPLDLEGLYGTGIVVFGGVGDLITANRVTRASRVGILIAPNPGIGGRRWPAEQNQVRDNRVRGSGLADLAILGTTPDQANCFAHNTFGTSTPAGIEHAQPCSGASSRSTSGATLTKFLAVPPHQPSTRVRATPVPPRQPSMPDARSAPARSATNEATTTLGPATLTGAAPSL